jgi:pantothenate kinase type III
MIERYADSFGSFPMVVATGGDAQAILENEDFVDRVVPDLILLGIAISVIAGFVDESAAEE